MMEGAAAGRRVLVAAIAAAALSSPAVAEYFTGELTKGLCEDDPGGWCWAFVGGAHDAFEDMHIARWPQQSPAFCVPTGKPLPELTYEFMSYLNRPGVDLDRLGSQLFYEMLSEQYPC